MPKTELGITQSEIQAGVQIPVHLLIFPKVKIKLPSLFIIDFIYAPLRPAFGRTDLGSGHALLRLNNEIKGLTV